MTTLPMPGFAEVLAAAARIAGHAHATPTIASRALDAETGAAAEREDYDAALRVHRPKLQALYADYFASHAQVLIVCWIELHQNRQCLRQICLNLKDRRPTVL